MSDSQDPNSQNTEEEEQTSTVYYATDDSDIVVGSEEGDEIHAQGGVDTIYGGDNTDYLFGGSGGDTLTGGAGADIYAFGLGDGSDTITDFNTDDDTINLSMFGAGGGDRGRQHAVRPGSGAGTRSRSILGGHSPWRAWTVSWCAG